MHDVCFGLTRRPFASVPQIDQYFPGSAIENARTALGRCIQRGEGLGLVLGPSGTGKTLLCLMLAKQFYRSFRVAMLPGGRLGTRRALFQAILYELGRPYRGMDEGELRLAVVDDLSTGDASLRGLVLLADEAHLLPLRLLEELRLLTNLACGDQPLVRLVLAGGSVLEERFASPKLDSFNQRVAARCYLDALNRTETQEYIGHQITSAGGHAEEFFSDETCQTVFQAAGGVPRLINQVCDHAMLLAYVAGRQQIMPSDVEEAWADLQQLPTPWNGEPKSESTGGVIEFGSLDESTNETVDLHASETPPEATTPMLRISPTHDEVETAFGEPSQQIHRIEQLLAEADDDFQPAGSIVPEIELRFEDALHPFQEDFDHEEVINDRYASASRVPAVQQVSASSVDVCDAGVSPMEEMQPRQPLHDRLTLPPALPSTVTTAPAMNVDETAEAEVAQIPLSASVATKEPVNRNLPLELDDQDDRPTTKSPAGPMRPQEFRRLFAQLRKG